MMAFLNGDLIVVFFTPLPADRFRAIGFLEHFSKIGEGGFLATHPRVKPFFQGSVCRRVQPGLSEDGLELLVTLVHFLAAAFESDVGHVIAPFKKIPSADVNEVTPKEGCSAILCRP